MTFSSHYVLSIFSVQHKTMPRYQIRIEDEERLFWQEYANQYFRGNLAKMIRTLVTQAILTGDFEKNGDLPDELYDLITDIKSSSTMTTEHVRSFQSDLTLMKSLLSQIVNFSTSNQSSETQPTTPDGHQLKSVIHKFVESQDLFVTTSNLLSHLREVEPKFYDQFKDNDQIHVKLILEEVQDELYEETGDERFLRPGGNQYDF
ncbi:MAG: hypothetical protein ACW99Q_09945 [Candidatus Kariarchaeaceae archaeon]